MQVWVGNEVHHALWWPDENLVDSCTHGDSILSELSSLKEGNGLMNFLHDVEPVDLKVLALVEKK